MTPNKPCLRTMSPKGDVCSKYNKDLSIEPGLLLIRKQCLSRTELSLRATVSVKRSISVGYPSLANRDAGVVYSKFEFFPFKETHNAR